MLFQEMQAELFDWLRWREGSPADLFVICREPNLIAMRKVLKAHAVGWCNAENLTCRPKIGCKAVMFFKDGHHFWFHLTNKEFEVIFSD